MDLTPIVARLSIIANSVSALQLMQEMPVEEFEADDLTHTAAQHYLQMSIQAALDIGNILLAEAPSKPVSGYAEVFPALGRLGVLPLDFANRVARMAKLRNVLVHMYFQVDLTRLHAFILNDLQDLELFAQYVTEYLDQHPGWTE